MIYFFYGGWTGLDDERRQWGGERRLGTTWFINSVAVGETIYPFCLLIIYDVDIERNERETVKCIYGH
jgi:hypothetical protein